MPVTMHRRIILSAAIAASTFFTSQTFATTPADSRILGTSALDDAELPLVFVNEVVGAMPFYNGGLRGQSTVMANVEAGHIWNGHESLTHISEFVHYTGPQAGAQTGEVDRHATAVGHAMGGGQGSDLMLRMGIASEAQLWSGSIATEWNDAPYAGSFNINPHTFTYVYDTFFNTGINGRTADVINSSWGSDDTLGTDFYTIAADAMAARNPLTTFVTAAGNAGPDANTVSGLAAGYNGITVGALADDTTSPVYSQVSDFSSRGASDYDDPVNGTNPAYKGVPAGVLRRATVDLVAPGQNLTLAYYGGTTGGNSPTLGTPVLVSSNSDLYLLHAQGTSFASPIVAGGVALLADYAYAAENAFFSHTDHEHDARVLKAVLLNSADKLPGWSNNQHDVAGVITTTQALDHAQGAGRMNLFAAYETLATGTRDLLGTTGGVVQPIGWDFGVVSENAPNDYQINQVLTDGSVLTATLTWFRDRDYLFDLDAGEEGEGAFDAMDLSFDDLDLELWRIDGTQMKVAESISGFNNVEHFTVVLAQTGTYMLRVNWFGELFDLGDDANAAPYALAWSVVVPEPGATALLILAAASLCVRRRPS